MKVLVTGGAGFVGHHLVLQLLDLGHDVAVLDNFSTGLKRNLVHFRKNRKFRCVEGDVRDRHTVEPLIRESDVIFNLAASVGVRQIMTNPIESIENNIFICSNVLKFSNEFQKRVFLFSTSEVYGKSKCFPFSEETDVVLGSYDKLRWCYAASKLVDDFLGRAYFETYRTNVTMIRLFNTIGVGQVGDYGMVVPRFFEQAQRGRSITVYGDGQQTRCFTDVRDVVRILPLLIENRESFGELVNIGSCEEISILDLACKIQRLTRSRAPIEFSTFDEVYGDKFEDMMRRVPDQSKMKRLTGATFLYQLDDSLRWIYESVYAKRWRDADRDMISL